MLEEKLRLKLVVAYQGTRYSGWQLQALPGTEGPQTVQGKLEQAIASIVGKRIPVHGAGRTDAGVHAEAQVCHIDLPPALTNVRWRRALNTRLPEDIRVLDAKVVPRAFHSRINATGKRYAYSLWMGRDKAVPRIAPFVWSTPALSLPNMELAAAFFVGTHDFASFQNSGTVMKSTVRTISAVTFMPGYVAQLQCPAAWPVLTIVFEGNAFLKQMVRNLVGMLVWTGLGKCRPEDIPTVLQARDRAALPSPSAPAGGLTLLEVIY